MVWWLVWSRGSAAVWVCSRVACCVAPLLRAAFEISMARVCVGVCVWVCPNSMIAWGKVSGYPPKKAAEAAGLRPIPGCAFKT